MGMKRFNKKMECSLCGAQARPFDIARKRRYYQCNYCQSILLDPDDYVSVPEEKERYEKHNNDVHDPRYQEFVSPIANEILNNHQPHENGLDFGSGTGPVITKLLRDTGYQINTWDPFFDNDPSVLEDTYHYIACCEVAEHFHHPRNEFKRLRNLLKPGGILYCMTEIYTPGISFQSWNYKNDVTHVIFYHTRALEWICQQLNFSNLSIQDDHLIAFTA